MPIANGEVIMKIYKKPKKSSHSTKHIKLLYKKNYLTLKRSKSFPMLLYRTRLENLMQHL